MGAILALVGLLDVGMRCQSDCSCCEYSGSQKIQPDQAVEVVKVGLSKAYLFRLMVQK